MKNVKKFDIESYSIIIESLDESAIKKAHIIASQKDADKESCPVDQRSAIAQHRILLFSNSPITKYLTYSRLPFQTGSLSSGWDAAAARNAKRLIIEIHNLFPS